MLKRITDWFTRSTLENPSVPISSTNIISQLGLQGGAVSKVHVSQSSALKLSPVWQCVNMISGDVAKLPLEVFKRTGPKSREKDRTHRAYRALARDANPKQHATRVWRRAMVHKLLWQRAYLRIVTQPNGRLHLYNLLPDRTKFHPELADENSPMGYYVSEVGGKRIVLFPSEVMELEGMQYDDSDACKLIHCARDAWGVALATQNFKAKFYDNGAVIGGVLEIPANFTGQAADELEVGFRKKFADPDGWFKTAILRDGAKFHQTMVDPEKQQLLEATEQQAIDVCRWFNMQPSRIGVRSATSYGSKTEDNEGYFDQTLSHHCCDIRTECWMKLTTDQEKDADSHVFEHNTRALFQMNAKTQAEVGKIETQFGALSINDYLAATNRNPVPGGDIRMVPKNMYLISGDGVILNPDSDTPVDEDEPEEDTEDAARASIEVLGHALRSSYNKVARTIKKEAGRKDAQRFARWWQANRGQLRQDFTLHIDAPASVVDHFIKRDGDLIALVFDALDEMVEGAEHKDIPDLCQDIDDAQAHEHILTIWSKDE